MEKRDIYEEQREVVQQVIISSGNSLRDFHKEPITNEEAKQIIMAANAFGMALKEVWEKLSQAIENVWNAFNEWGELLWMEKDDKESPFVEPICHELINHRNRLKYVQMALKVTKHTVYRKKLLKKEVYYEKQVAQLNEYLQELIEEMESELEEAI